MFHLRKHNTAASSAETPASGALAAGQQAGGYQQQNTIVSAPIIQESVRNDRIVEVQPVVHRSIDRNIVHHVERHIREPSAPAPMNNVIERPPLVQEHFTTHVVNEVQPIIHRERVVPVHEMAERHHVERVSGPTVHTHEVVYDNGQGYQGYQQQAYQQQAQPTGLHQTPMFAAPMGRPTVVSSMAKAGKRHHHGVLHSNRHFP